MSDPDPAHGARDVVTGGGHPTAHPVRFAEALRVWLRIACLSFGGPAGQIAVMHRILVEEKRWISESRFLHALNYCMLLPGPEAQQLATYVGWLLHRGAGGLVAGTLFILPGFFSILVLSMLYVGYRDTPLVAALLFGLKPAVVAVVVDALIRIGRRTLRGGTLSCLAAGAFVAIFLFEIAFPLIVVAAGLLGALITRWAAAPDAAVLADRAGSSPRPTLARTARVGALWLLVWLGPLAGLAAALGPAHVYVRIGTFFSTAAVVTFGGAYAVLAYVAQQAVEVFGWLRPGEMLDGLGMAESTPGPLIQVVQFVGFLGAYRSPEPLGPMAAGLAGSLIATWATFAPCFLWIFAGAPYVEHLRGRPSLSAALAAITAAVVGAVANLAVWFALHTLFARVATVSWYGVRLLVPDPRSLDPAAAGIVLAAGVAMLRFRVGMVPTLAASVVGGAVWFLLFRA